MKIIEKITERQFGDSSKMIDYKIVKPLNKQEVLSFLNTFCLQNGDIKNVCCKCVRNSATVYFKEYDSFQSFIDSYSRMEFDLCNYYTFDSTVYNDYYIVNIDENIFTAVLSNDRSKINGGNENDIHKFN